MVQEVLRVLATREQEQLFEPQSNSYHYRRRVGPGNAHGAPMVAEAVREMAPVQYLTPSPGPLRRLLRRAQSSHGGGPGGGILRVRLESMILDLLDAKFGAA